MLTWADGLVALTLAVSFWGGYRSGVVRELIGMLAIIVAWALAGAFAGATSPALRASFGLSPAASHLAAFWLLFLVVFAAARAAGWVVERFTAKPLLRVASGLGGASWPARKQCSPCGLSSSSRCFSPLRMMCG